MSLEKPELQILFGRHVKKLRIDRGLTQQQLGDKMNKDQQNIHRIESGKVSPSLFYLFEIAEAFSITISELMKFELRDTKSKHD